MLKQIQMILRYHVQILGLFFIFRMKALMYYIENQHLSINAFFLYLFLKDDWNYYL